VQTRYALDSDSYHSNPRNVRFVQEKEDRTNQGIMMLNANAEILESLRRFYKGLMTTESFIPSKSAACQEAVADFILQLDNFIQDFKLHSSRANTLKTIIADRKNLVRTWLRARVARI
jgi:hypothetical protein